jgi:hypothetical protein
VTGHRKRHPMHGANYHVVGWLVVLLVASLGIALALKHYGF